MKKIGQIILYTVIGAIVIALVLTAVLKKDYAPKISVPAYASKGITIESANTAQYDGLSDEKNYNEFVRLYKDCYKLTILYSLFSGEISREQKVENAGKNRPNFSTGYLITFDYAEDQVLKVNGKDYVESVNTNEPVKYNQVVINILKDSGLSVKSIYFRKSNNLSWYKLTTIANFDSLYNFISKLPNFAEED